MVGVSGIFAFFCSCAVCVITEGLIVEGVIICVRSDGAIVERGVVNGS